MAVALSFLPRLAWGLIILCFIELSLGIGVSALSAMKLLDPSLLPSNNPAMVDLRFRYHPLLQGTPIPNYSRLRPFMIHHDSQGLRGSERSTDLLKQQIVIATLGGSTTYDIGNPEGQTWSDFLEQKLGHEYAVLNYGVPGYSTVENLIQTLFYMSAYDIRPRCAVYYLGWNDIRNAYLPHLDQAYADFHLLSQLDNLQVRWAPNIPAAKISLLARLIARILTNIFDTVPLPEDYRYKDPGSGSDVRLEMIFRANVRAIAAINKDRKITSIFVGQILNRARLTTPSRAGWLPLVRDMDVWPLQEHFNHILKDTAEATGSVGFIPQVNEFQDADFVDNGHFSARGAEKFASMLAPLVRDNCKN
jgi:lysophospholipase L1-like esterase